MSARTRAEKRKKLRRAPGSKVEKRTIRVFAEGQATEVEYIEAIRRAPAVWDAVSLEIVIEMVGATPMTLVDAAAEAKRQGSLEVDEYWCVYDVESPQNHPHLDRAENKALDNGLKLAISNPCFELWLALHHDYCSKYLSTDEAISLRSKLDKSSGAGNPSTGKHIDPDYYLERVGAAMRRAELLRKKHEGDGTHFPHDNPSSSVDLLMRSLGVQTSVR